MNRRCALGTEGGCSDQSLFGRSDRTTIHDYSLGLPLKKRRSRPHVPILFVRESPSSTRDLCSLFLVFEWTLLTNTVSVPGLRRSKRTTNRVGPRGAVFTMESHRKSRFSRSTGRK